METATELPPRQSWNLRPHHSASLPQSPGPRQTPPQVSRLSLKNLQNTRKLRSSLRYGCSKHLADGPLEIRPFRVLDRGGQSVDLASVLRILKESRSLSGPSDLHAFIYSQRTPGTAGWGEAAGLKLGDKGGQRGVGGIRERRSRTGRAYRSLQRPPSAAGSSQ